MKREYKELLLKDICSRLPYKVKCKYYDCCEGDYDEGVICGFERKEYIQIDGVCIHIEEVKPYLLPLSSMTEEQAKDLFNTFGIKPLDSIGADYIKINECTGITFFLHRGFDVETHLDNLINWLNKNHFDYRGLIPMGLANDATGLNIY